MMKRNEYRNVKRITYAFSEVIMSIIDFGFWEEKKLMKLITLLKKLTNEDVLPARN